MEDPRLYECGRAFAVRFEWWDVWCMLYKKYGMTGEQIVDYLKADANLEMVVKIATDSVDMIRYIK